jgi:hypothetical protein
MVRLQQSALSRVAARRDIASALLGRAVSPLDDERARLAADDQVAPLLARVGAPFATTSAAAIVTGAARVAAVRAGILDDELRRVYVGLSARGLSPIVIKGVHLAHTVYPDPLSRPRSDTDLLVDPAERQAVERALLDAGYETSVHVRGSVILGQHHFERRDRTGVMHRLDVHWRVAAPLVVEPSLTPRDIIAAALPIPTLAPAARGPALDDALAIACVHLVAHHLAEIELRWAYDLHLLARGLGTDGRDRFVAAARRRRYSAVCAHALASAAVLLEDQLLASLSERLGPEESDEPTAALLHVAGPGSALWLDLRTAGWRDRLRLVREHLVPDAAYMRKNAGGRPLILAYTTRAITGVRHWFSAWDRTGE